MSSATKTALDNAIHEHLADECEGAIVTGYVFHASYINNELDGTDQHGYYAEYADGQAIHTSLGLAHMHLKHIEARMFDAEDDDDD